MFVLTTRDCRTESKGIQSSLSNCCSASAHSVPPSVCPRSATSSVAALAGRRAGRCAGRRAQGAGGQADCEGDPLRCGLEKHKLKIPNSSSGSRNESAFGNLPPQPRLRSASEADSSFTPRPTAGSSRSSAASAGCLRGAAGNLNTHFFSSRKPTFG